MVLTQYNDELKYILIFYEEHNFIFIFTTGIIILLRIIINLSINNISSLFTTTQVIF